MYYQAGLVLEGGGMKGLFTSGVLDFFLEKDVEFTSCYGVSAGACNMASYLSKQKERAYHVNVDYLEDKAYCSPYSLLTTGDLFGVDMCYHKIPEELNPYDYDTYNQYEGNAYSVVTNIITGEPEYILIKDMKEEIDLIRASASLPLVSRNVIWNEKPYLDGGLSDAIPIKKSIMDGNQKNVVITTKEVGYRRKPSSKGMLAALRIKYARYPKVCELVKNRYIAYNGTLDYLDLQEKEGRAFVIRPQQPCDVGRIEKDEKKLKALYQQGYEEAKRVYEQMHEYLEVAKRD